MFWGWIPPGLNLSEIHARGRGGLQPGASRDCRPPLGAARKPTTPLGVSHGEARKPTAPPRLLHGEVRKPTTAVAFARAGLFRPRGRPRRRRKRFASLYRAEKPVFTKRRRLGDGKSFFVRRFVACFFARPERNWRCRRGKSPPPRNPGRPAAARPTTATGSRFLRRQRERPPRRPRPSPPAREGSLGAPNDRTFPPGAERKARKEKGKEEPRMKRAPPL